MTPQDRRDRADNLRYWWEMTWPGLLYAAVLIGVGVIIGVFLARWL